jgi:hypothetical protein
MEVMENGRRSAGWQASMTEISLLAQLGEARYWDEDFPDWDAEDREFAVVWRSQPKWVVLRSLKSVGPNSTLVADDFEKVIRGLEGRASWRDSSCRTGPGAKPDRGRSYR